MSEILKQKKSTSSESTKRPMIIKHAIKTRYPGSMVTTLSVRTPSQNTILIVMRDQSEKDELQHKVS